MKYCPDCQRSYPDAQRFCLEDGRLLSLPDPYHLIGRTLADRYSLDALVGIGGMGAVYSAHHLGINRHIAIKILQPNIAIGNEQVVRLFEREAKMTGRLLHENIANVFDAGHTSEGLAYIAMEWLEGRTLEAELAESGPLSFTRVAEILRQVAAALNSAHAAHIIHRDLKPSNVMLVRRADGGEQIKVLDFGIAKVVTETGASPVSSLMGTPHYASPEQFKLGAEIDGRSDIYSLGVMLYQMLTGVFPFSATSIHELIQRQLHEPPPPLRQLRPDAPKALEELLNRMLSKEPEARPQLARMIPDLFEQALRTTDEASQLLPTLIDAKPEQKLNDQAAAANRPSSVGKTTVVHNIPVNTPVAALPSTPTAPAISPVSSAKNRQRWLLIAAGLLIMLSAAAAFYFFSNRGMSVDSIAVLPFANETGDPNTDYLSDGISESLIGSLAKLPGLRVIARSSVARYKTAAADPQKVGQELKVRAVLMGRLRQQGDAVTITAELIDTRDNSRLWGESFDRRVTDLLSVQSELTRDISARLRSRITGEEQQRVTKPATTSNEAYQLYLKGRYHWNKRSPESLKQAEDFFRQAIDKDPLYALAYSGLADTYLVLGPVSAAVMPAKEAMPKQRAAALEAIKLDDSLAEAHTSLAVVRMTYDWDWAAAEREFKRAIELNPNYALAHQWYGSLLSKVGRHDEALVEYSRAQELDPFSRAIPMHTGMVYFFARRYDEAIAHFRKLLEANPKSAELHGDLALAYEQKKMYAEAITEMEQAIALSERSPDLVAALGRLSALSGKKDDAEKIRRELGDPAKVSEDYRVDVAQFYVGLGDYEQAIRLLQQAAEDRSPLMRDLKVREVYDPLRADPRFVELVKKVGLDK